MIPPHVAIAGGGPAGFLCALLLSSCGVPVTVLEKSAVADPWSTKSYSIGLNNRGLSALDQAGVLEDVKAASMLRRKVIMEMPTGAQKELPKDPPNYAVTRPALVECLEGILQKDHSDCATIQRGVSVTSVASVICGDNNNKDNMLAVTLDDDSTLQCTHVIAADGKWSAVRNSMPEWKDQFVVQSEPAFGVIITPSVTTPERWAKDATTLFLSKNPKYYCLAAPLPDGKYSVSAVFFDEIEEEYPWLVAQDDKKTQDWEAEYGIRSSTKAEDSFQEDFAALLKEEMPLFYKDINEGSSSGNDDDDDDDDDSLLEDTVVRINRRTSWLKSLTDNPVYCDTSGRVALVGDAAHAMTPSNGEGCNCALESAVSLTKSLLEQKKDSSSITVDDITQAFVAYGNERPPEVVPIQVKSAVSNRYTERVAPPAAPPKK